ncbi:hypothetical protein Tel_14065 [Candidatus Tenderia electrophaga]|jgi:hypothetical protein|uniref:Uncharacterized protein n=1 Tax=Candidatus Tenderia electrophaga TaxID=1748243 RepID=A0A0S2TG83_9GAMM|nr:hypothetical protein Tel_14065 [Candidatus Tenderia electrophaga]
MTIDKALRALEAFQGDSLTESLSDIESRIIGLGVGDVGELCAAQGIDETFMDSAIAVKRVAGQINVIIHAAGILRSLPGIIEPGEKVESVSLGAGNTGRQFDLETNMRVAEYKFIDWQGGPESIRQNGIFKDFFELAEYETHKKKYLYVVGTEYPLKFFSGGRALTSVLSRYPKILERIQEKYGDSITKVRDYYEMKKREVTICDVTPYIGRNA